MSSSRLASIVTERPSLPSIHDLFGEHLGRPIKQSSPSPFAFNLNSSSSLKHSENSPYRSSSSRTSTLPGSQKYHESTQSTQFPPSRFERDQRSPQLYNGGDNDERSYLYKEEARRFPPSRLSFSVDQDDYSPPSTASGDEHYSSVPERKKLPAKYECEYCGKCFNRPSSLKIHHNTHTGQKPFSCVYPGCGRNFSVMSNMRRHARTHGDYAMQLSREQSDSELNSVKLTPVPSASGPNSRNPSGTATIPPLLPSTAHSRTRKHSISSCSDSSFTS